MSELVSVVTGGSKGIGLEIVKKLLEQGHQVAACSRSVSEQLEQLLSSHSDQISWYKLDLEEEGSVKETAKLISKSYDQIDVLINCAAVAQGSSFLMTRIEELRSVFNVNFFNTMLFTQIVAKKMIRKKQGAIVNIASTAGLLSDPGTLAYGGSKASLIHATKVLATELGAYGIRVNAVAPAIVNTEMAALNDQKSIERAEQRSALSAVIEPEDVAEAVLFLATMSKSSKITGQVIRVDKGIH
ncbi:SDR family NAD(P)-dependent oxidoreductase [Bacterioplanoides sp.]|uniref:SDR family NAD(P)-dependent oxidoreductase n=1 Tax=Bacterioplanoides sp. TaxID=2066072 RepID=UPI003B00BB6D